MKEEGRRKRKTGGGRGLEMSEAQRHIRTF